MQFMPFALSSRSFKLLAAGSLALSVSAITAGAQQTDSAKKPAVTKPPVTKPGPTLIAVSAGPNEVTHVVKKGDTLWDLAKEYLKDPFRWPDVFQRNTDIVENPHWIYPGETIRIPASEVKPEVLARITTKPAPPSDRTVFANQQMGLVSDRIGSNGEVLGRESTSGVPRGEIEGAPFTDRIGGPRGSGRLAAAYDRPGIDAPAGDRRFQLKDRVFVELPSSTSAREGDVLVAYRLGPELSDDAQVVIPTGLLRIESREPGKPALARVMRQFGEIHLDQEVMSLADLKPSVGKPAQIKGGPTERVVYVAGEPVLPSLQNYVILSANSAKGVKVGDQFTLIDDSIDPRHPAPPVPAAIVEVVRVTPYGVTAIVVDQEQPRIRAGMPAQLSGRAP
jgi:LysM repeat protein